MAVLYTPHFVQFFDNDGAPLAGGKLYTYAAGTTTPKATYTTYAATVENSNPLLLDSAGRAVLFINGSYKFRLEDADGTLVKETDNITAFDTGVHSTTTYYQAFSGNGGTQTFNLSGRLGYDEEAIFVFIDSGDDKGYEVQSPSAYTLNDTSISFSAAPASGTNNIRIYAPSSLIANASSAAARAEAALAAVVNAADGVVDNHQLSVLDYGAVADAHTDIAEVGSWTDNTAAFNTALSTGTRVYVPAGRYYFGSTLEIPSNRTLFGAGKGQTIFIFEREHYDMNVAKASWADADTVIGVRLKGEGSILSGFTIANSGTGMLLLGNGNSCTDNIIEGVEIVRCTKGMVLDGGSDSNYPTYWNYILNGLIRACYNKFIQCVKSTGGDAPNENNFLNMRLYKAGQAMGGTTPVGIDLDSARYGTVFTNTSWDLATTADAGVRFGDDTGGIFFDKVKMEILGGANGFWDDSSTGGVWPYDIVITISYTNVSGMTVYDPNNNNRIYGMYSPIQKTGQPVDHHYFLHRARFSDAVFERQFAATEDLTISTESTIAYNTMTTRLNNSAGASVIVNIEPPASYNPSIVTGTATSGGSTTITDSSKSWTVSAYVGCRVYITGGTGSGQDRKITGNTATALTVDRAWGINPDATSTYKIYTDGNAGATWRLIKTSIDQNPIVIKSNGTEIAQLVSNKDTVDLHSNGSAWMGVGGNMTASNSIELSAASGTLNVQPRIKYNNVYFSTSAGTVQLPSASLHTGIEVNISVNSGSKNVTLQHIDGSYTVPMANGSSGVMQSATVFSNGTNWSIKGAYKV
jgi:hypothetical protein